MRNYILTEKEREALLDYLSGMKLPASNLVTVTIHRYRRNRKRYEGDLELLRTVADEGWHGELNGKRLEV